MNAAAILDALRSQGWSVAIHNDYRYAGQACTFWLLTHPSGEWVKGEGATDFNALSECCAQIKRRGLPKPAGPYATRIAENGSVGSLTLTFDSYDKAQVFWRWIERVMQQPLDPPERE